MGEPLSVVRFREDLCKTESVSFGSPARLAHGKREANQTNLIATAIDKKHTHIKSAKANTNPPRSRQRPQTRKQSREFCAVSPVRNHPVGYTSRAHCRKHDLPDRMQVRKEGKPMPA